MNQPRHKLPLKKVRLQSSNYNLYEKNRTALERIPKAFVWIIGVTLFVCFVLYFDFLGLRNPQQNASQSSVAITPSQQNASSAAVDPELKTNDTLIKITDGNKFCYLQFSATSQTGADVTSNQNVGWWSPNSNCTLDIKEIAITREDGLKTSGTVVNIDTAQPRTVAVIFGNFEAENLAVFVKELTLPIFQDRIYFSANKAMQRLERGTNTWFLHGRCQNTGLDTCAVFIKKSDGNISRIYSKIFENQTGATIQFAPDQPTDVNAARVIQTNENGAEIARKTILATGEIVQN